MFFGAQWYVYTGSDYDLMPSDNKPLSGPISTIFVTHYFEGRTINSFLQSQSNENEGSLFTGCNSGCGGYIETKLIDHVAV